MEFNGNVKIWNNEEYHFIECNIQTNVDHYRITWHYEFNLRDRSVSKLPQNIIENIDVKFDSANDLAKYLSNRWWEIKTYYQNIDEYLS